MKKDISKLSEDNKKKNEEKEKRTEELLIANKELADQNEEMEKRVAELVAAIKKKEQTETVLKLSEERYRKLFESAKDGILIIDSETGKINDVNPYLLDMLGFPKEAFVEKAIWEIGLFKDIIDNKEKFMQLQKKEYIRYENMLFQTAKGQQIQVEFVSNVYSVGGRNVVQCNIRDLTDRNRMEEENDYERDMAKMYFDAAGVMFVAIDKDEKVMSINREGCEILGYKAEDILGKNWFDDFIPKSRVVEIRNVYKKILGGEIKFLKFYDTPVITATGEVRLISWHNSILHNVKGLVSGIFCAGNDITERNKAECALRESENLYRTFINSSSDMVFLKDENFSHIVANENLLEYFNKPEREVIGKTDFELMPKKAAEQCRRDDIKALRSKTVSISEETEGDHVYETIKFPVTLTNGQIGVGGYIRDITDRKRAEEALYKSEKKYSGYIENAPDGVYVTDQTGRYLEVNRAACDITGYSKNELLQMTLSDILASESVEEGLRQFYKLMETGSSRGLTQYRRKDGSKRWWTVDAVKLSDNRLLGFAKDITDRKKAQDDLKEKIDELNNEIAERVKAHERIEYLAYHDYLTGLPNRLLFSDRLNQTIQLSNRIEKTISVMLLDVDNFKIVNDSMGHEQGDELLKAIATRLSEMIRKSDTVARIVGDEFLIMVQNLSGIGDILKVAEKIINSFNQPFKLKDQDVYITISIGVSIYLVDGDDGETLIKNAGFALYKAKEMGKNQFVLCSPTIKTDIIESMRLGNDLHRALERNELVVYYQPQVNRVTKKINGVEALLRWNHPELGMVSPGKFIPIAEQTGLIIPIGEWVMQKACFQNKAWQEVGLPHILVAVNLSVVQIQNPNIVDKVANILAESGLDPQYLELEVTESIVMKESDYIIEVFNSLKNLGVTIALDDFGTDYSSLQYLKQLPIDRIKIPLPFVQGIGKNEKDEAIIKSVIVLARNMGMSVIAEGVETRQQLTFLDEEMCDDIQGFYYYKPMPSDDIEILLNKNESIDF